MTAEDIIVTTVEPKRSDRISISDIKVGPRFRKDLGDLETLVKSIQEIGLLHPVVINQNNELIAGARRLEACKSKLGWDDVPVTIIDLKEILHGELHENAVRKDFTVSERVTILEEIERQRIGHKPVKGDKLSPFQKQEKGKKSRDIASRYFKIGPVQLQKEKKIVQVVRENPDDTYKSWKSEIKLKDILEKVDNHRMKVNEAISIIKRYEYGKARLAQIDAEKNLPSPPPLTDKEIQDLKSEQDRILKEAYDKYLFNENEYEDLGNGIRLIQGNPLEVSFNTYWVNIPVSTVICNKRTTVMRSVEMERYGIEKNSIDLIFTNPSYSLHNMIPQYNNHKTNPPSYREISYLADNVLKEGGNIIIGIRYQFHRLIPAIVYFISHNCDYERHSNYGLFHTSASCDSCRTRFNSIIICDGHLLLLWFTKRKKKDDDSNEIDYSDIEEKNVSSIDDVIKHFTADEKDVVVLDPLMDYGDIGIAARRLGRRFIGIEQDSERFNTAQLRIQKEL